MRFVSRFEHNGLLYETISSSEAILIGTANRFLTKLTCPSHVGNLAVTQIARDAFRDCELLELLYLSDKINKIQSKAFYNCKKLKQIIQVPDARAIVICDNVFENCVGLEKVYMNASSIGICAFKDCVSLSDIFISHHCKYIATHAFLNCSKLTGVKFEGKKGPVAKLILDDDAFENCALRYIYSARDMSLRTVQLRKIPSVEYLFPKTASIMCTASSNMNEFAFHGYTVMEWKT